MNISVPVSELQNEVRGGCQACLLSIKLDSSRAVHHDDLRCPACGDLILIKEVTKSRANEIGSVLQLAGFVVLLISIIGMFYEVTGPW